MGNYRIDRFKHFNSDTKSTNSWLEDSVKKHQKENKDSCLRSILNRDNRMSNVYDKIKWEGDILKIGISYFDYGKGTGILPFMKNKSLYFDYWIDFKNKKLYDKNLFGGTFDLTDEELDQIENKYHWFKGK